MKFSKFVFVMTVMVIGLNSCQKDNALKSIAGTWEGKWGYYTQTPSNYEKWTMEEGGDLNAYLQDGTLYAVGTWDENGGEIEVHYTVLDEPYNLTFQGMYDENEDEITGNWNDDDSPIVEGTFVMQRQ